MQCKPSLNGVRLIPESALESDAIERWRGKVATLEVKEYSVPAHAALEFRDPPATEPMPEPWRPAVGDWVLFKATREAATVVSVFSGQHIGVQFDRGGWIGGHIREFEPIITAKADPETPRRTIRVPAIGQRVKAHAVEGIVRRVTAEPHRVVVTYQPDHMAVGFLSHATHDHVIPIGPNPRWIEITLPEEEKP